MTFPRALTNLDPALSSDYVAAPWIYLPADSQAQIIGELSRFCAPDWDLTIDPSVDSVSQVCFHDWAHGAGAVRVNNGFPLCVGCAVKLLTGPFGLLRDGEHVAVEVLREVTS